MWIKSQTTIIEKGCLTWVKSQKKLSIEINGHSGNGYVLKPSLEENYMDEQSSTGI